MADAPRYVLGINAYDHDVAACLLRDGAVVVAIAKERVTRIKHASGFFAEAVDYCLETAGIGVDDLSLVVRNCYMLPVAEMERRLRSDHQPYHLPVRERPIALASPLFAAESDRVRTCSHHLAHAYSAFAASPFDRGAVMIVDGVGSYRADVLDDVPAADEVHPLARESESYYRFEGTRLETVKKVWLEPARGVLSDEFYTMAGLGAVYSRVSTYIFGDWNKCGEVMGLAPYGKAGIEPLLHLDGDALRVRDWGSEMCHPNLGLSDVAWQKSPDLPHWQEVAWRVQQDTEEILVQRARRLREVTGERNLCMAGGVALNCVANARVARESGFEKVWIQPAAGDDGIAIGCALYGHLALQGGERTFVMTSPYTGRASDRFDVDEALRPRSVRFFTRARRPADVAEATAEILAGGAVIGWLQGGSEIGPRALGHRSILADPRDPAMKDRVNARVKHRQAFRPFAPVVLREKAHEYFEGDEDSPYMLLVKRVRPEAIARIPAIVHVDGTARVQTLTAEFNPLLHALLTAFEKRTGVAVLLNTSFNLRGEPIVEHPIDAVDCFLGTHLDALVLDDVILEKRATYGLLAPLARFFARVRRSMRSEALMDSLARRALRE